MSDDEPNLTVRKLVHYQPVNLLGLDEQGRQLYVCPSLGCGETAYFDEDGQGHCPIDEALMAYLAKAVGELASCPLRAGATAGSGSHEPGHERRRHERRSVEEGVAVNIWTILALVVATALIVAVGGIVPKSSHRVLILFLVVALLLLVGLAAGATTR